MMVNHHMVVKASEVTGVKVKNLQGEHLGEINEIVIDIHMGQVSYLVLDFGGFLGFGNKFFAIPWVAFTYSAPDGCFILNLNKKRLESAPGFDKDKWPNFASPEFLAIIDSFYK